jgi:hypothetical protein
MTLLFFFLMPARKVKACSGKPKAQPGSKMKKKQAQNGKPARHTQKKTVQCNKGSTDSEPSKSDSEQTGHEDSQPRKKIRRTHESEVEEVGDESDDKSSSEAAAAEDDQEDSAVQSVQK